MPLFGRVFLTSTYLLVDQDRQQFTLWRANATEGQRLVPLGRPTCNGTLPASNSLKSAASSALVQPTATGASAHSGSSLSKGGIVGVSAATLVITSVFIAALLVWTKRQQHRKLQNTKRRTDPSKPAVIDPDMYSHNHMRPEMPCDWNPPQELPLQANTPYSLPPHELQADSLLENQELPSRSEMPSK